MESAFSEVATTTSAFDSPRSSLSRSPVLMCTLNPSLSEKTSKSSLFSAARAFSGTM